MPAIASLEDLKAAQKDLRSMFLAVTPDDLPACSKLWRRQACPPKPPGVGRRLTVIKKWCRMGWENICKLEKK